VKSRLAILVAAPLALSALSAGAQEAAPTLQEDPRAAKFKDVERGFFVGFEAGYLGFLSTKVADPVKHAYASEGGASSGVAIGVHAGIDLFSRGALSVFVQGVNERADVNYGAFSVYAAGVDLRWAFLALQDRNGWDRFFAYGHLRGGYARSWPTGLFGDVDTIAAGGVGVDYYTRLRHFSVGVAADFVRAITAGSNGWAIYPTIRYTF
jgi:hypothetical protein